MTQRAAKSESLTQSTPGAFLPDGSWNERGELHHRGEVDRLVRALCRERKFARLTPAQGSQAIQASSAVLAFPNWRQWAVAEHWALVWTATSAEEMVKRAGETVAGEHHWCGAGKWLPGPERGCDDPIHRVKPDAAAVRGVVSQVLEKVSSAPAGGTTPLPSAPTPPPDDSWPGWVGDEVSP